MYRPRKKVAFESVPSSSKYPPPPPPPPGLCRRQPAEVKEHMRRIQQQADREEKQQRLREARLRRQQILNGESPVVDLGRGPYYQNGPDGYKVPQYNRFCVHFSTYLDTDADGCFIYPDGTRTRALSVQRIDGHLWVKTELGNLMKVSECRPMLSQMATPIECAAICARILSYDGYTTAALVRASSRRMDSASFGRMNKAIVADGNVPRSLEEIIVLCLARTKNDLRDNQVRNLALEMSLMTPDMINFHVDRFAEKKLPWDIEQALGAPDISAAISNVRDSMDKILYPGIDAPRGQPVPQAPAQDGFCGPPPFPM